MNVPAVPVLMVPAWIGSMAMSVPALGVEMGDSVKSGPVSASPILALTAVLVLSTRPERTLPVSV